MKAERALEKSDGDRTLVQHNQGGPTDTVVFYPYYEQRAVLMIHIGNKDKSFPASGSVSLLPPTTTREGIDKFINNSYSDALHPDAPEAMETIKLPADIIQVKAGDIIGQDTNPSDEKEVFDNYRVKLSVKKHNAAGKFTLSAIEDDVSVFLKK